MPPFPHGIVAPAMRSIALLSLLVCGRLESAVKDYQSIIPKGLTPKAKKCRRIWLGEIQGENLAAGKKVVFSVVPQYRLTHDANDAYDLTDGKLTPRKDDRMWFDKAAVGWTTTRANLLIDLGDVHPIGKVAVRFLGGGEQGSLNFPRKLELAVSTDGKTFYRAGTLSKLMLGEKDRAGQPGVFFLPEEGTAYAYPLVFRNLRTKARFIGVKITGDGFVFADELAVLKGAFTPDSVPFRDADRTSFIIKGISFAPFKAQLAISTNVHTPNYFRLGDFRKPEDKRKPVTFVVEVPAAVTILAKHATGTIKQQEISTGGQPFRRYTITKPHVTHGRVGPFYLELDKAGLSEGAEATFYAVSQGYEPNRVGVPIAPVEIPRVGTITDLHVSLAWMGTSAGRTWPGFFDAWEHLGFNAVATFPRYWRGKVSPENKAFLAEARRRGMKVIYNESPFHVMHNRNRKAGEIYSQIKGKPSKNLCPSYRGPIYQAEIQRVGRLFAMLKPDYVFYDIECWYRGATEAPRCARCKGKLTQSGKKLDDFLTDCGTEMIRDMGAAIKERCAKLGLRVPHIATYNNHAARPVYHRVFDFRKLYPPLLNSAQPSLYVRGNAVVVHNTIRKNYQVLGTRDIIPWLSAGTYGEFESYKLEANILESLLNGACGITYYCFSDFDTPMDWYYHAKALAHIKPYQGLLKSGKPVEVKTDNPGLFVSGYRHQGEMLVLVGNYQNTPKTRATITLPFTEVSAVKEVRSGKPLGATPRLAIDVPPQEIRLVYAKGEH